MKSDLLRTGLGNDTQNKNDVAKDVSLKYHVRPCMSTILNHKVPKAKDVSLKNRVHSTYSSDRLLYTS